MYIYIYICVYIYMYAHVYMYTRIRIYLPSHLLINLPIYLSIYPSIYLSIYLSMCLSRKKTYITYISVYTPIIYVYIHVCVDILVYKPPNIPNKMRAHWV